jgi:hypothetical protein
MDTADRVVTSRFVSSCVPHLRSTDADSGMFHGPDGSGSAKIDPDRCVESVHTNIRPIREVRRMWDSGSVLTVRQLAREPFAVDRSYFKDDRP